jgi:hypothetical protein
MVYRIETETFEENKLDVDAVYIIHLEGNGRLNSVRRQLHKFCLCRTVHIVYNKGSQDKKLPVDAPSYDLVDAYKHVFRDAALQQYGNIAVFEDDFFLRTNITKKQYSEVNSFLKTYKNDSVVYHLGCVPGLMVPIGQNNYWTIGFGTHACVYSPKFRERVLQYKDVIYDWDVFLLLHSFRVAYDVPLCYQLFPETANKKNWTCMLGITFLIKCVILMLHLDTQAEPGYSICYFAAKTMFYVVLVLLLVMVWCTIQFFKVSK